MVGVARFELATPAMSTQCFEDYLAENHHFLDQYIRNKWRTDRLFVLVSPEFHRSVDGSFARNASAIEANLRICKRNIRKVKLRQICWTMPTVRF